MQILTKTDFSSFEKALTMPRHEVVDQVRNSGLRGRGGANFPTGVKWDLTRKHESRHKVFICNADEGEPGTFKDRFIITNNPDLLIEGIAIAAYAIGADRAYIYLRAEYEYLKETLDETIERRKDSLRKIELKLDVFMGAGAYICGDETAILNSIEGRRGSPRLKPPYPADQGLFGLPTCVDNVATLANVPLILAGGWKDLQLFSLSGNLRKPGVYELPAGLPAGDLIAMGEPVGDIKALFFGCAGGCVRYDPEMILDAEHVHQLGDMLGSCAVIAVGRDQSIPRLCANIAEFFVFEGCGQCTPCREGNYKILRILRNLCDGQGERKDLKTLRQLAEYVDSASFCGLGQAGDLHILTALEYFSDEFEALCRDV